MQSKEKKWNGVALEFLLAIATLVINKLFFLCNESRAQTRFQGRARKRNEMQSNEKKINGWDGRECNGEVVVSLRRLRLG